MNLTTIEILVKNLEALASVHKLSQAEIARRGEIPQKTVNNLYRCIELNISPGLDTIERVGGVFGVEPGALLSSDLIVKAQPLSISSIVAKNLGRLVEDYLESDNTGKDRILAVAAEEAAKSNKEKF